MVYMIIKIYIYIYYQIYIYIYTLLIYTTLPFPKSYIYVWSKINPRFIAYVVRNSAWPW